jgi:lipid-binding SYLF domain-containing protein
MTVRHVMTVRFTAFRLILPVAVLALGLRGAVAQNLLDQDAEAALQSLYSTSPAAKALGERAKGILVFPSVTKAGFIVGGQGGDGALFRNGKPVAHYSASAATIGMQAGVQSYAYALFFQTDADLAYLTRSNGWSLGVGPNIVVVDAGAAMDVSTLTGRKGVYAFVFDQKGLMAGVGLVGQKISRIR